MDVKKHNHNWTLKTVLKNMHNSPFRKPHVLKQKQKPEPQRRSSKHITKMENLAGRSCHQMHLCNFQIMHPYPVQILT